MPLNDRARESAKTFRGQKSGVSIELLSIGDCVALENFYIKEGTLVRQNGTTIYANVVAAETGGVRYLGRYNYLWLSQRGNSLVCETVEDSATFVSVTAALNSRNRLFDDRWRDNLYLTNGFDTTFFNDNGVSPVTGSSFSYKKLGLDPPTNTQTNKIATADFTATPAGNVATGSYYYIITFYDGSTNSESPGIHSMAADNGLFELDPNGILGPIPLGPVVLGAASHVDIDHTKLIAFLQDERTANPRITHFIIYRAQKTAGIYNAFQRVPITNTTQSGQVFINISTYITDATDFIDNTANANLPAVVLPTNNSPPPTPARSLVAYNYAKANIAGAEVLVKTVNDYLGFRKIRFFRDQMFGVGSFSPGITVNEQPIGDGSTKVSGRIFNYRDLLHGSEVYQPDYWPYVWEIGRGDGQKTTALGVLGDIALCIFKERSIYYLSGSSPNDYIIKPMDTTRGCVHESTIQETPYGIVALDKSGFIIVSKIGNADLISREIQDVVDSIQFQNASNFYSWYDTKNNIYYCAIVVPGSTTPNKVVGYNLRTQDWFVRTGFDGLSEKRDFGSDNLERSLFGANNSGRLYNIADQTVVTNNFVVIRSRILTGPIFFGDENRKKRMKWIYINAYSNTDYTIDINIIPDYDTGRQFSLKDISATSSYSLWYASQFTNDGTLIWDVGNWSDANATRKPLKIPVSCVGRVFQIEIINRSTVQLQYGFVMESLSCEAVMMGK